MACCYENCSNTRKKNPKLTFFRFPKEKERRYLWMKKCNNISIQNLSFEELQNRVVCEEHFLPKCFDYSVLTSGKTRRSLFKFAVPQPSAVISACKEDLVSPQRLMNITENLCLLVPPISPPPANARADDGSDNTCKLLNGALQACIYDEKKDSHLEKEKSFLDQETEKIVDYGRTPAVTPIFTTATTTSVEASVQESSSPSAAAFKVVPSKDCIRKKYKKILPKKIFEERSNIVMFPGEDIGKTDNIVLDLRGLNINKLERAPKEGPTSKSTTLLLDKNRLQMLPMIDSYSRLTRLSLANNEVDSFIWFGRLSSLRVLNLSRNKIADIDGLWKLWQLIRVDLSGNFIEIMKGETNDKRSNLEYLDISNNKIRLIEDISMASNLKELLLHKNNIKSLHNCKNYLPKSLVKLTLAENSLINLGDLTELSNLDSLKELTLKNNICINVLQLVDLQGNILGPPRAFNYRPFIAAICSGVSTLDFKEISEDEKRKANWLLSQTKFKEISLQDHSSLVNYLSSVCPSSESTHGEEFVKLPHDDENIEQNIQDQSQIKPKSSILNDGSVSKCNKRNNINSMLSKIRKGNSNKSLKIKKESPSKFKDDHSDCVNPFPCKHYIELIEERARNYKLKRRNETLSEENLCLYQRLQVLESTLTENGIDVSNVKIEELQDEHDDELCA